jgi:putative membrane protein
MKRTNNRKIAITQVAFISTVFFIAVSCGNSYQTDQTRSEAEEHNDAKFNNSKSEKDAEFLVNATEINLEEIQLGQLAQKNGTTTDVRELGRMMEAEHTKSLRGITELARQKQITLPTSPSDKAEEAYKDLSNNSSTDFDKKYCKMMVNEHKDAIALFEKHQPNQRILISKPGLMKHSRH